MRTSTHKKRTLGLLRSLCLAAGATFAQAQGPDLKSSFQNPPDSARPGVYWYTAAKRLLHLKFAGTDHTAAIQARSPDGFAASTTAGFLGNTAENPNHFGRVDNFTIAVSVD